MARNIARSTRSHHWSLAKFNSMGRGESEKVHVNVDDYLSEIIVQLSLTFTDIEKMMTLSFSLWNVSSNFSSVCIFPQYSVLERVMKEALRDIFVNFGCFWNTSSQTIDAFFGTCMHKKGGIAQW